MIQKIAAQIRSLIGRRRPETAIILGSGLGALADEITDSVSISYADIDGFPQSTVQGHGGKLIIGRLEDKEILCMQGRFHLYEGHKPQVTGMKWAAISAVFSLSTMATGLEDMVEEVSDSRCSPKKHCFILKSGIFLTECTQLTWLKGSLTLCPLSAS